MDLIIISGLPRSGTSFMGMIFNKMPFDNIKCISNTEDAAFGSLEPSLFSKFYNSGTPINDLLKAYLSYWRHFYGDMSLTLVYKHPQFIFSAPPDNLKIKYILCTREFESWKISMATPTHNFADPMFIPTHKWAYNNWGGPSFELPKSFDDRAKILYSMYYSRINHYKNQCDTVEFKLENPKESLQNIANFLNIDINIEKAMQEVWKNF
jgi:hypothetical protein